ncbi:hypothetical protein RvY_02193 [Ramazzottius varieornatus]|uniref:HTH psq-type domain-containing protein n=1 Tax=Ramazzottius varieornatus TaxID=947166 RepID=A0A1D1UU09_RAMVA|nr:hypothetical protein RvY_02193 [Ramazzottius varieornatus]
MSQPFKTQRHRRYTQEALKDALSAVENGMAQREGAPSNVDRKKAREWTVERAELWIELLSELEAQRYLPNPEGIINLDEFGFILGFEREKVYAEKGRKHVVSHTEG